MDGAEARDRYSAVEANVMPRRVRGRGRCAEVVGVSLDGTASSADLGGSSKYSNENFEDRSGEGFRENSNWSRVIRS